MLIHLICSDSIRKILTECIETRGMSVNPDAKVALVEKGCDVPEHKLAILFDYHCLGDLTDLMDMLAKKPDNNKNIIVGKREEAETYEVIPYDSILYFEAEGNYTYCVTGSGKSRVRNKLYELETTLLEQGFVRISKSILVNIMAVAEIIPWFGSRLLLKLKGKREIEVSRSYVKDFKDFLEI